MSAAGFKVSGEPSASRLFGPQYQADDQDVAPALMLPEFECDKIFILEFMVLERADIYWVLQKEKETETIKELFKKNGIISLKKCQRFGNTLTI